MGRRPGDAAVAFGPLLGRLVSACRLAGLASGGDPRDRPKRIDLWRLCRAVAAAQPPGRALPLDQPDLSDSGAVLSRGVHPRDLQARARAC